MWKNLLVPVSGLKLSSAVFLRFVSLTASLDAITGSQPLFWSLALEHHWSLLRATGKPGISGSLESQEASWLVAGGQYEAYARLCESHHYTHSLALTCLLCPPSGQILKFPAGWEEKIKNNCPQLRCPLCVGGNRFCRPAFPAVWAGT